MSIEIERKFLVQNDSYKTLSYKQLHIRQGYLTRRVEGTVRIRIVDTEARLTVKGKSAGASRLEFEYSIPYEDGLQMLGLCEGSIIEKTRYLVRHGSHTWEVDEFHGHQQGLTIAEIELCNDNETFSLPDFVSTEVTGDPAYYNSSL